MPKKLLDVLVVGAGPVGLFCANELIRHGLSCRIIDKKAGLSEKSKALGLHIRTLDVMEDAGFIDTILAEGLEVEGMLFKSKGKELVNLTFVDVEANRHYIIDLPQDRTEHILCDGLHKKGIDVDWQTELTDVTQSAEGVLATITLENGKIETINASWIIACDGAHSTVRHLLKMAFLGAEYKENWWLADLIMDWDMPSNRMIFYPHEEGALACFPMRNKRYRLVMMAPEQADEPTMEDITAAFNRRSSDPATLSDPIWITKFNLHHRQIQQYRKERIFFAGDAAHIHSPMGGQGLNTGIQDVYNLVWKLALVQKNVAPTSILDSYHIERYPVGRAVLKKTDMMTKMILLKSPLLVALRNAFISMMMSRRFIRTKFATDIAELNVSYTDSPIVSDRAHFKHIKAGTFLADFKLIDAANKKAQSLNTIIQGTAHHLFLFAGAECSEVLNLAELATHILARYPTLITPHLVVLSEPIGLSFPGTIWIDEKERIHRPSLILLRPDKYIGLTQSPVDRQSLLDYLDKIFI